MDLTYIEQEIEIYWDEFSKIILDLYFTFPYETQIKGIDQVHHPFAYQKQILNYQNYFHYYACIDLL